MKRLETTFAGLKLKNPFIVSSCNLTNSAEKNKKWEDAGVGAVVLKSLFEEEIEAEADWMNDGTHAEELDYLQTYYRAHRLEEYLRLIKETKALCSIPVIASINCYQLTGWTDFAKQIQQAGADAIELNIMSVCSELDYEYGAYERLHIDIVQKIKQVVSLPIVVKLGRNLTNPMPLIHQLYANGASGVVMFNRMVTPDINLEKMTYTVGAGLGHPSDFNESLRWIGLASHRLPKLTYAASGGVQNGESMIKALLVGASAVEVCSVLYKKGADAIQEMLQTLETWMEANNYEQIADFKGLMNAGKTGGGTAFERTQFFKHYGKYE
jgi:dihydroorotate dehydrogenase (fumarate)